MMKSYCLLLSIALLLLSTLSSCSKDETDVVYIDELIAQENTVTVKVYSDNPESEITLGAECCPGRSLVVTGEYEWTVKTTVPVAMIVAWCDDPETLITGEIYINGELKAKRQANTYLKMGAVIKGHPAV